MPDSNSNGALQGWPECTAIPVPFTIPLKELGLSKKVSSLCTVLLSLRRHSTWRQLDNLDSFAILKGNRIILLVQRSSVSCLQHSRTVLWNVCCAVSDSNLMCFVLQAIAGVEDFCRIIMMTRALLTYYPIAPVLNALLAHIKFEEFVQSGNWIAIYCTALLFCCRVHGTLGSCDCSI